jgi:hypothetical protein
MADNNFKIETQLDYSMKVKMSDADKKQLLRDFSKSFFENSKMMEYFCNPDIDPKEKVQYMGALYWMLNSLKIMYDLLLMAGVSNQEIAEELSLPFC